LYATPVSYQQTGWVSLMVTIRREHLDVEPPRHLSHPLQTPQDALAELGEEERRLEEDEQRRAIENLNFCMELPQRFRGGDLGGKRASQEAPAFIPYGFEYERCI